jgi:protease-4
MKLNGKLLVFGVCLLMAQPLFSQNVILELNLNTQSSQSMLQPTRNNPPLEIFRVIERAGNNKQIGGMILNISSFQAGRETIWELRNALEKFKSKGKKICAFISNADLDTYYLATVADKIVMDDMGTLVMMGYALGWGYVQHSLEKLGIGARELRYFEYKSAMESYTRDSLSDADRRQYGEVLDDLINITCDAVTKARSWTVDEFNAIINNEFLFSAKGALERGIVDYLGRKESVYNALKEIIGIEEIENIVLFGDHNSSLSGSKSSYHSKRASRFSRPPVIAVIYASGVSDMERGMEARNLARIIEDLSRKRRVKALILRIDSPGGSAEAADYVAEAVKKARERIPVVVSMGSVAASGGYWASMTANHIIASPVTLTGSIGVIGSWFYDKGLNSKLGITVDALQRGDHADLLTGVILPTRDLTPAEEARYRKYMIDLYGDFTTKVAAGRGMDLARVESIAQGRVYSGLGALNVGLIDSIGGLDDAVRIARELAKTPDNKQVLYREYPKPKFFDKMMEQLLAAGIFRGRSNSTTIPATVAAVTFAADLFLPGPLLDDLRYRIAHNGQVMPILPLYSGRLEK